MSYDNTNSGILARNQRKETDKHPDFTGSLNVDGTDYWLSAWVKERKDGTGKFFSLSIKPKEQAAPQKAVTGPADMDDDLPFANPYRGVRSYVV